MPAAREAFAAAIVVGNSEMRVPSAVDSATCALVASSWEASAMPRARHSAAIIFRCGAAFFSDWAIRALAKASKSASLILNLSIR